jgi:soluble P-type ATPase
VIRIDIPGQGTHELEHLVLDLTGTIASDGQVLHGVGERPAWLSSRMSAHLLTADTRGSGGETAARSGVKLAKVVVGPEPRSKRRFVEQMGQAL